MSVLFFYQRRWIFFGNLSVEADVWTLHPLESTFTRVAIPEKLLWIKKNIKTKRVKVFALSTMPCKKFSHIIVSFSMFTHKPKLYTWWRLIWPTPFGFVRWSSNYLFLESHSQYLKIISIFVQILFLMSPPHN